MANSLEIRIYEYSPWLSAEGEREKLEALDIRFTKCRSCGHKYPEQRVDKTCDQCEA